MFDDMIADIKSNKKFQAIIKELFIRCRKLNILVVFITQSYKVSKAAKKESDYNYEFKYTFYKFYRDFKKSKRMSLGCKSDEINDFIRF